MDEPFRTDIETDPRFPTGAWVGFWLQRPGYEGRQAMRLELTFSLGKLEGSGSDTVGEFAMRGRYDVKGGKVTIHKDYATHHVLYEGWAESGKGIWGVWKIGGNKDGFHLWPKGMRDPSRQEGAAAKGVAETSRRTVLLDA